MQKNPWCFQNKSVTLQKLSFALRKNNVLNYGDKRKKKANLSQTHTIRHAKL